MDDVNLREAFHSLPSRFIPEKAKRANSFYFSIDGEEYTVKISPEGCEVAEGKQVENPDCFLQTSKEILINTFTGKSMPSMADIMTGKVKTNNPLLLLEFKDMFRKEA